MIGNNGFEFQIEHDDTTFYCTLICNGTWIKVVYPYHHGVIRNFEVPMSILASQGLPDHVKDSIERYRNLLAFA